jgi:hypothetical protein
MVTNFELFKIINEVLKIKEETINYSKLIPEIKIKLKALYNGSQIKTDSFLVEFSINKKIDFFLCSLIKDENKLVIPILSEVAGKTEGYELETENYNQFEFSDFKLGVNIEGANFDITISIEDNKEFINNRLYYQTPIMKDGFLKVIKYKRYSYIENKVVASERIPPHSNFSAACICAQYFSEFIIDPFDRNTFLLNCVIELYDMSKGYGEDFNVYRCLSELINEDRDFNHLLYTSTLNGTDTIDSIGEFKFDRKIGKFYKYISEENGSFFIDSLTKIGKIENTKFEGLVKFSNVYLSLINTTIKDSVFSYNMDNRSISEIELDSDLEKYKPSFNIDESILNLEDFKTHIIPFTVYIEKADISNCIFTRENFSPELSKGSLISLNNIKLKNSLIINGFNKHPIIRKSGKSIRYDFKNSLIKDFNCSNLNEYIVKNKNIDIESYVGDNDEYSLYSYSDKFLFSTKLPNKERRNIVIDFDSLLSGKEINFTRY